MLKRKVQKSIIKWIKNDIHTALLVSGARQCGKTYLIEHTLEQEACDYIKFNLIEQPEVVDAIAQATDSNDLIFRLSLLTTKKITPSKTFIFLDEIQKYKEIVTKVKFLVEDGRFRYILSGSLLGVEITGLSSAPVGYLKKISMYPLDFEEFIQIYNPPDDLIARLKEHFENKMHIDDAIHNKIMAWFNQYLIVGGMPRAVSVFKETWNIDDVIDEHIAIMDMYRLDFTQYEQDNKKLILTNIYDLIPAELNEKNKRFQIADINKSLRYDRMVDSFVWLWKAGVALPTFNVTEPTVPFEINKKASLFKMFLSDVGLLTTMYGKATKLKIIQNDKSINNGAVYENYAAQELIAHGFHIYYYNNKKHGELDFLIERNGHSVPIEIKSGKDYQVHSALSNVIRDDTNQIEEAMVFSNDNISTKGKIQYLPIYMMMFINEVDVEFPDLSQFLW